MPIGELQHGDHACLLFDTPGEQLESVVPAVEDALATGEQCIYVGHEPSIARVADALTAAAVDVPGARQRRALRLLTERDVPLASRDRREITAFWDRNISDALADGFTGVMVTGEMTGALSTEAPSENVAAYERLVSPVLASRRAAAICQYNTPRLWPGLVDKMLRVHSVIRMPLTAETDVVAVRRRAWAVALELGFGPGDLTLMWRVLSALALNTVERGRRGELTLRRIDGHDRVGMRTGLRVEQGEGTAAELVPRLDEIEQCMDEFEVLSGPGRAATMRMTKWVR